MSILSFEERSKIVDKALRELFKEMRSEGLVPEEDDCENDFILMHTEGGEADAVAVSIENKTAEKILAQLKELGEIESGYGDNRTGDCTVMNITTKAFNKIFGLPDDTVH